MNNLHNGKLTENSQKLRTNMTKEERKLWYEFLKYLPVTFRRQKVIGNYIVDFYCSKCKLVIELDGSQHYEEKNSLKDKERDAYLNSLGIKVIRFSNLDVLQNFVGVCEVILSTIEDLL